MKTMTNTFALLFAAFAFTACTQSTIDPVKSICPAQSTMRADSTRPYRDRPEDAVELIKPQHGVVSPIDEPAPKPATDQPPVTEPEPHPRPHLSVMPAAKEDTLVQQ